MKASLLKMWKFAFVIAMPLLLCYGTNFTGCFVFHAGCFFNRDPRAVWNVLQRLELWLERRKEDIVKRKGNTSGKEIQCVLPLPHANSTAIEQGMSRKVSFCLCFCH
jgi:hypothetical protein